MSLKKFEIINELSSKYGITIKSVRALNSILVSMGIIEKIGGYWSTTPKGLKYTIYNTTQVLNADLWHEEIVSAIAKYLAKKLQ